MEVNMETTGLNFLEAHTALIESKCEKIEAQRNPGIYYSCKDFLGEWKLIGVKQKIEDVGWLEGDCPNRQVCRARLTQKAQNEDDFGVG